MTAPRDSHSARPKSKAEGVTGGENNDSERGEPFGEGNSGQRREPEVGRGRIPAPVRGYSNWTGLDRRPVRSRTGPEGTVVTASDEPSADKQERAEIPKTCPACWSEANPPETPDTVKWFQANQHHHALLAERTRERDEWERKNGCVGDGVCGVDHTHSIGKVITLTIPEMEAAYAFQRNRAETAEDLLAERTRERDEWERKSKNNGLAAAVLNEQLKAERAKVERLRAALKDLVSDNSWYAGMAENGSPVEKHQSEARAALKETG
jgi:hypothetical protein